VPLSLTLPSPCHHPAITLPPLCSHPSAFTAVRVRISPGTLLGAKWVCVM
jgi:hypothetical protein